MEPAENAEIPSTFTPMPLDGRRMDRDELDAELRRLEAKLAAIKRDFATMVSARPPSLANPGIFPARAISRGSVSG